MASPSDSEDFSVKNENLFTIEASVVTGFEECARGEAKEKFEADVKTSRGKITWKIPPSRLPEVLKMKSIDNCKVVMHSIPHFKFTDQNDSLARIQKMILDVDWDSGLKAWGQLFHFPHPIASRPDIIPSPEDLVDVVVMTRLPQPKDKSDKKMKNQKKVKGKKRDDDKKQRVNKKEGEKEIVIQKESLNKEAVRAENLGERGDGFLDDTQEGAVIKTFDVNEVAEKLSELDTHSGGGDCVDIKLERSNRDYCEAESESQESDLKFPNNSNAIDNVKDKSIKLSSDREEIEEIAKKVSGKPDDLGNESAIISETVPVGAEPEYSKVVNKIGTNAKDTKSEELVCGDLGTMEECKSQPPLAAPKTVVVKKITSAEMLPKIDIKVIQPVNVFPTALESQELRHLEPMEVDSPNASFNLNSTPVSLEKRQNFKERLENDIKTKEGKESETHVDRDNRNALSSSPTNVAAAFATSVIKRLSSSPTSPPKESRTDGSCTTPPPTPIASVDNPFVTSSSSPLVQSTEVPASFSPTSNHISNGEGSSVDPVPYNSDNIPEVPYSQPADLSETTLSASNVSVDSSDAEERPIPVCLLSNECENETKEATGIVDKEAFNIVDENITDYVAKELTFAVEKEITNAVNKETSETEDKDDEKVKSPEKLSKPEPDPTKPKFRVTCNRVGEHPFDSSSAAASFGSAVITYFKWPVDLKKFDIEVLLNIDNEEVSVSIALTKTSLHNRNMVAFGPTTLRPTICYNMLRLCRIRNGDFICDPMCGTSAIPIESALNWTNCFTFGGDYHEKAIERTAANISAVEKAQKENNKSHLKLDAVQWNINNFPLKDSCVDVFVSDLPFGHRLGCRTINRTLYPSLLSEMARTARPGARACLLTEDKTSLIKAIQTYGKLWQRRLVLSINIGGLSGFVFVLIRTTTALQRACTALAPANNPAEVSLPQSSKSPVKPTDSNPSPADQVDLPKAESA